MTPSSRSAPEISSAARCDGCGLAIEGGTNACQELFEREMAREFSDYRFARHHRMAVDTYALQHPDSYCASAKSLAAHLTAMCVAFENPGHPTLLRDLQRWLSGPMELVRPPPQQRGEITIAGILSASDPATTPRLFGNGPVRPGMPIATSTGSLASGSRSCSARL